METERVADHKLETLYFGGFANDLLRTLATKNEYFFVLAFYSQRNSVPTVYLFFFASATKANTRQ